MNKGFTLVELVIVIVIVGILSIVAVPVYQGYVEKARITEAKTLLNSVMKSQKVYYIEYAVNYASPLSDNNTVLNIDARANAYFNSYSSGAYGTAWSAETKGVRAADYLTVTLVWPNPNSTFSEAGFDAPFFKVVNSMKGTTSYSNT